MFIYQKMRGRPSSFGNHITVMKLGFFLSFANSWFAHYSKSLWKLLVESYLKLFENTFEGVVISPVGNECPCHVCVSCVALYLFRVNCVCPLKVLETSCSFFILKFCMNHTYMWDLEECMLIVYLSNIGLPLWLHSFLFTDTGSSSADTQNCNRKFSWSLQMWRNNFSLALHQIRSQSFCCAVISNGSSKRQTQSVNVSLYNLFLLFRIFVLIQVL